MFVLVVLSAIICGLVKADSANGPRYFHTPMHEVVQNSLFLKTTKHEEIIVAYAERGSDLREGDYLTHADGIRVLNGGLQSFLKSGDKEAVVPIVDEHDSQHGGSKFLGFVLVQVVQPRKLSTRRGEVIFDLEEGGPPPTLNLGNIVVGGSGAKTTSDPSYVPPPHGTGACITGKDCYNFNGTCIGGQCSCLGVYTGTYCQLNRPDMAAAAIMKKRAAALQQKQQQQRQSEQGSARPKPVDDAPALSTGSANDLAFDALRNGQSRGGRDNAPRDSSRDLPHPTEPVEPGAMDGLNDVSGDKKKRKKKKAAAKVATEGGESRTEGVATPQQRDDAPRAEGHQSGGPEARRLDRGQSPPDDRIAPRGEPAPSVVVLGDQGIDNMHFANVQSVEDLYGDQRKFPTPNAAGRLPNAVLNDRHRLRNSRTRFVYAVRFRVGPFGLVFDNRPNNATVVETVIKGQQAEQSDVRPGDRLVAIDTFDVSRAPAKVAQRILSSLSWPIVLAFETQVEGTDPQTAQLNQRRRSFNLTVLYPPHLTGEYTMRLADWAPPLLLHGDTRTPACPVFRARAPDDLFACDFTGPGGMTQPPSDLFTWADAERALQETRGFVDGAAEARLVADMVPARTSSFRFLALLLQESFVRKTAVDLRTAGIAKRGVCTFVDKARGMSQRGAQLSLVVNTDNELIDAPAGKSDKTADVVAPFGLLRNDDGSFLNLAAKTQDVFFVVKPLHDDDIDFHGGAALRASLQACESVSQAAEDLVDRWPHSVPALSIAEVLKFKPPDQVRFCDCCRSCRIDPLCIVEQSARTDRGGRAPGSCRRQRLGILRLPLGHVRTTGGAARTVKVRVCPTTLRL